MKRFLVGPLLAALAMFVWGFLYWGLPHYLPYKVINSVPDDAAALQAMSKVFPTSGYYLLPNPVKGDTAMGENTKYGIAEVSIVKEGQPAMDPKVMALGFVHCFAIALFLAVFMSRLDAALACAMARVKFCTILGLLVALYHYSSAVWWHQPIGWVTVNAIYDAVEFAIAGLVLAKFLTPKASANP